MNPKIVYTDLSQYTFGGTVGSGYSGYEITNLHNYVQRSKFTGGDISLPYQTLTIDLGSARAHDHLIIDNHNLSFVMANGTASMQRATDSGFTSGVETVIENFASYDEGTIVVSGSSSTKRYYRIVFDGDLATDISIGNIFIDAALDFQFTYQNGFKTGNYTFNTNEFTTQTGLLKMNQTYGEKVQHELSFSYLSNSVREDFVEFVKGVRGKALPFYFFNGDGDISYVNMINDYTPAQAMAFGLNDIVNLNMRGNQGSAAPNPNVDIYAIYDEELITTVA